MNFFKRLFGKKDNTPKESLLFILLLSAPKKLERATLEAMAKKAWLADFGANDDGADFISSGSSDSGFVLAPHGNAFILFPTVRGVRQLSTPRNFPSAASAEAWANYTADVSLGIVHKYDTDEDKLRGYLAKLTAELIDESCLALLHPASGRIVASNPDMPGKLRANPSAFMS